MGADGSARTERPRGKGPRGQGPGWESARREELRKGGPGGECLGGEATGGEGRRAASSEGNIAVSGRSELNRAVRRKGKEKERVRKTEPTCFWRGDDGRFRFKAVGGYRRAADGRDVVAEPHALRLEERVKRLHTDRVGILDCPESAGPPQEIPRI